MTPTDTRPGWTVPRWAVIAFPGLILAAANITVATGTYVHFLNPVLGFLAAFGLPLLFLYLLLDRLWNWPQGGERLVVAVALTVLGLMSLELILDLVLPHLGVTRPLDTWPVLATGDVIDVAAALAAYRALPARLPVGIRPGWSVRARLCTTGAVAAIAMAAMGAVRLDNGAGGGLTEATLGLVLLVFVAVFRWRDQLPSWTTPLVIYCASLALLFMTSLRGWYTTGHDVQQEMQVFLATAGRGRWMVEARNGYNGCLSITILPTLFLRWTRVAEPYVFKVFFQCLYAFAPVTAYYVARRFASEGVAILSCVYFVGFVGFVQDMPMLNRQEIGFLFFFTAVLVLLMDEHSRRGRWVLFCVLGAGMVLSHYSTTYFGIGMMGLALVLRPIVQRLVPRLLRWNRGAVPVPAGNAGGPGVAAESSARAATGAAATDTGRGPALAWLPLAIVVAMAVIWNVPVNRTGSQLTTSISNAVHALSHQGGPRAGEANLTLIRVGRGSTQAQAVDDLVARARTFRNRHPQQFIVAPPPSSGLTPIAPNDQLKLTPAGRLLTGSARAASLVNRVWRDAAAGGLQLLMAIGLAVALLRRRQRGPYFSGDGLLLALATVFLLVAQLVLPMISLDYGVARSFMQCLLVLGPFVVLGTMSLAIGKARQWQTGLALGVALAFFASTTGLVPQLLGAYGPQLHLNNAGDYYDRFYLSSGEVATTAWLDRSVIAGAQLYPDIQMDPDMYNKIRSLGGVRAFTNIYPSDIQKNAFVVLGRTNVAEDKTELTIDGRELWLEYPLSLLDATKNLIYNNGTSRIYR